MISAILKYSIGSLFYGGLITALFICLFVFLIKGWYKDAVFKPISFVVLGVLALLLLWHSTIICGALAMKSDITSIQQMIENAIATLGLSSTTIVDAAESNEVIRDVIAQHPILGYYVGAADFTGWPVGELPGAMCNTLREYLNGVIRNSLLWSLGFVIVGAFAVIKSLGRGSSGRRMARTRRSAATPSRTAGRRRPSRR